MKRWTSVLVMAGALALGACGAKGGDAAGGGGAAGEGSGAASLTQAAGQKVVDGVVFEGWERGLAKADDIGFALSFKGPKNDRGAGMNLLINGMNCMGPVCTELTAEAWKKNEANLKSKLASVHVDNPELVYEISEGTVDGKKVVETYAMSFVVKTDDTGTSRASTHMVDVYWHDGAKMVVVSASAGYTGADNKDDFVTKVTKDELKSAAELAMKAVLLKL